MRPCAKALLPILRELHSVPVSRFLIHQWKMNDPNPFSNGSGASAQDIPVLYKSNNFLVVNKPFDVRINSDNPAHELTVENVLRQKFPELIDASVKHAFRFQHRLDHATSGALCLPLNKKAAASCFKCFERHLVTKHYFALVRGLVCEAPGHVHHIDIPIGKDSGVRDFCKMCVTDNPNCENPRPAQTSAVVLQHGNYDGEPATKVLLIPQTGRTHQLRVHCHHVGHPIVGDYTYSNRQDTKPYRMMLHAYRLAIPMADEPIEVSTFDPFIPEIDRLWNPVETHLTYEQFLDISRVQLDRERQKEAMAPPQTNNDKTMNFSWPTGSQNSDKMPNFSWPSFPDMKNS